MRERAVQEIKVVSSELEARFDDFLRELNGFGDALGRSYNVAHVIFGTDLTLGDVRSRSAAAHALVDKFDANGGALLSSFQINNFLNSARSVINVFNEILSTLRQYFSAWGVLNYIDQANSVIYYFSNGESLNLGDKFINLFSLHEEYVLNFHVVFNVVSPSRAAFNFSAATNALSKVIQDASVVSEKLKEEYNLYKSENEKGFGYVEDLKVLYERSMVRDNRLVELEGKSAQVVASISEKESRINEISESTSVLSEKIQDYAKRFAEFDIGITDRIDSISQGNQRVLETISAIKNSESEIERLKSQAKDMLSSATVSGLASEFGTIRQSLSDEVDSAHKSFNIAILFMIASAIPLMFFVLSPLIAALFGVENSVLSAAVDATVVNGPWQYLGQVAARMVIMLPAVWYVTFASGRYNSLFKLREHYAYKYSMAVAVEGFKIQSPGNEDMIAALVFEQLAFNPADKITKNISAKDKLVNPIAEIFLNGLRKKSVKKFEEITQIEIMDG